MPTAKVAADSSAPHPVNGVRKGERRGGRQKGALNKATSDVRALASQYSEAAIKRLAHLMEHAESETAQVAAAREILDRAHGKPAQAITGDPEGEPVVMQILTGIMRDLEGTGRGLPSEALTGTSDGT
jgi:hypothetical protein